MNWAELRAQLACTGRGDEMCIDPWRPQHKRVRQEREALAICADCQHLDRCRAWVLRQPDDPSPVMVVGGMTPGQRRRARPPTQPTQPPPERQRLAPCGSISAYQRHRRRGEHCPTCYAAWSAYSQTYYQRRKAQRDDRGAA
jgi:hypothetical protein